MNIAVVGFGLMGTTHTQSILKNKSLNLLAIVDQNLNSIKEGLQAMADDFASEELESIKKYTSFDECLEQESLDAVHICVHTNLHYTMVKKALLHGLHVLVEKPFCFDIQEGEELIQLAKEKEVMLMVAHVVRFMAPYEKLKEWVQNKTYGKLKFLSLTRFSGVPQWGQWKEKQKDFGSSGGALFDLLIHDIDYAADLMDGAPDKIEKVVLPGKLSKHDYINASWHYNSSDVTVRLEGGDIFHANFPFQAGFMAQFENASVQFSTQKPESIFVATDEEVKEVDAGDLNEGYSNEINYFYDCIRNSEQPQRCKPESSLETIRICRRHAVE